MGDKQDPVMKNNDGNVMVAKKPTMTVPQGYNLFNMRKFYGRGTCLYSPLCPKSLMFSSKHPMFCAIRPKFLNYLSTLF